MFNATSAQSVRYQKQQRERQGNRFKQGDVYAQIKSISSSSEEIVAMGIPTKVQVTHPFLSLTSWDRAIPEQGTSISVCYNEEAGLPLMTMYRNIDPSEAISKYNSGSSLYKELSQGELDRMSKGMANTFHANRPVKYSRAGLVEQILNGDEMTLFERSPTFVWQLHQHKVATLEDEMRFGVVRRYKNSVDKVLIKVPIIEGGQGFAKEHSMILVNKLGTLIDRREGNVCDDSGVFLTHPTTGKNLRYQELIYTLLKNKYSKIIDLCGNCKIEYPMEATEGLDIDIPMGRFVANFGRDASITVTDKIDISTSNKLNIESTLETTQTVGKAYLLTVKDKMELVSTKDATVKADGKSTMAVGGFLTKLGLDGSHPLLFGDTFVQKLIEFLVKASVHTHPGVPPSPDFSSACITLSTALSECVSRNVTTK